MTSPHADLFLNTRLIVAEGSFLLIGLPQEKANRLHADIKHFADGDDPYMLFRDGIECTFLINERLWKEAGVGAEEMQVETGFRLVTIDRILTWDVVGFMARITQCLAEAGISVGVLSSFSRDHLLIKDADLDLALSTLNGLFTDSPGAEAHGL